MFRALSVTLQVVKNPKWVDSLNTYEHLHYVSSWPCTPKDWTWCYTRSTHRFLLVSNWHLGYFPIPDSQLAHL